MKLSTLFGVFLLSIGMAFGQNLPTKTIIGTTGTTTWSNDTVYVLSGYVRVDNGETLTIEAGTVVKAETGSGADASAFIVERDGKIMAEGTAEMPIIFTSTDDDITDPNDLLNKDEVGLWGGIIVCGDASTNTANNGNEQVEGIPATLPASVGTYGGNEDDDNSGILRYVSIRHTGQALASNNEIQGLTLAGVGRGTTIEFVESYASDDDGIEIFGGTVNLKNVSIAFASDDALDYDQGWTGNAQWVFIYQNAAFGDRTGEWDGADSPEDGTPFGIPSLANVTIIGNLPAGTNNRLLTFRANGGGKVYNSVFTEQGRGVDIQYKPKSVVSSSSYDLLCSGDLDLSNNVFWNVAGNDIDALFAVSDPVEAADACDDTFNALKTKNSISDVDISGLSYSDDGGLDPRFKGNSVYSNIKTLSGFFTTTSYKGAFGPEASDLWIKDWTALDHYGYLVANPTTIEPQVDTVVVTGTTGTTCWTSDKVYLLQGYVRVDNGDTLCIEAGTVVLAATGTGAEASALIVERNGYIKAEGTADNPIIFTSADDDVNDPDDLLNRDEVGLWGGIIVCGDASTNTANNGNEQVEGIPATLPASVGTYGGSDDDDNSGILRYVSIRHTGQALASNNEIQGLTLAGVGRGTTIEFVESYASDDDGIEIFGGTVNLKNISIAFASDDALDYDQGWTGNAQWVFIYQNKDFGDRTGEWDGADSPEDGTPFGIPSLANVTIIGNLPAGTNNRLLTFRANGGGKVYNSVFTEQGRGVDIQYKPKSVVSSSSYDLLCSGDLDLSNNVFWNVAGNDIDALFAVSDTPEAADACDDTFNALKTKNSISDVDIAGLSYDPDQMLDPRFKGNSVYSNIKTLSGFFTTTSYKGAFGPEASDLWIKGWTALDHYEYLVAEPETIVPQVDTVVVTGTTGTTCWTSDKVYLLQGYVRVDNGDTLCIEAGTVVLAATGSGAEASALIVERNGYIKAEGTADNPIIFTSADDDVNDPDDLLNRDEVGLWGGIIVCGDASTNTANNGNEQVEGVPATLPASVGTYGGNDDDDNSGILRYVSIRHTGQALASNNEIQGLTLAGVGRGTTIEFVESYASDDDGIEIFGGTVNLKNISIAFASDDALDYDQGWTGNAQWVFIYQNKNFGDRTGEWDGADSPEDGTPFGIPSLANVTIIGNLPAGTNNRLLTFRANGGGKVYNSVFTEQGRGVDIQYKPKSVVSSSSYDLLCSGDLDLSNNVFWNVAGNDIDALFAVSDPVEAADACDDTFNALKTKNEIADVEMLGLSYDPDQMLDPRFKGSSAYRDIKTLTGFFTTTSYKGAFGPEASDLWIKGWTALDHYEYLVAEPETIVPPVDTVVVTGTTGTTCWTSDKVYLLQGYVRVDNGDTLCIEAGTVVLAATGSGAEASALIVERNGYIKAEGTKDAPIIFTSADDDVNDPDDLLNRDEVGLWGGIIVCGDASTNTANNGNEQVEGIPATLPASVGTYGGSDDDDNSGILRYVSIRHTGQALASNNEIQGLTLAGVGRGTTIEFVESYASDDDGIEIFGGTVNLKNISIAFASDDALDYDQGWTGKAQWVFIYQNANFGDRTGEWDGADSPEDGTPFGIPTISNLTIIGNLPAGTNNRLLTFRANGGGKVYNSVFTEQGRGVDIQYKPKSVVSSSSYDLLCSGDLDLSNNVFWNVAGNDIDALFAVSDPVEAADACDDTFNALKTKNVIADAQIAGLSYEPVQMLDPRFEAIEVLTDFKDLSADPFFTETSYKGAFGLSADDLWIKDWTALDHYEYLVGDPGNLTSIGNKFEKVAGFNVYPNPNSGIFTLRAENLDVTDVELNVIDLAGRTVYRNVVKPFAGELETSIDISSMPRSVYILSIKQGNKMSTVRVVKR